MKKKLVNIIVSFCVFIFTFALVIGGGISTPTFAKEVKYSGVLDDLHRASNFKEDDYLEVKNDYSLQVINVAESTDSELFIYVYQPSGKTKNLVASSINISTTINDKIDFHNYKLIPINSSGVFYKYKVDNFVVLDNDVRYYAISSIYRFFDDKIDNQAEHGNKVTEIEYKVAKQYCLGNINGKPYIEVVDIETIEITDKFVGFVRYSDGFKLYNGACYSHFVAFNTDRRMDKLLEADVYYTQQSYNYVFAVGAGENEEFGEKKDSYAYLKYTEKVEHTGDGLFAGTYKWNRIETVDQFVSENSTYENVYAGATINVNVANSITEEGKKALQNKKWVLRFAETQYSLSGGYGSTLSSSTIVGDVTILRLKFETDGVTYNLGAIDNKQSGSDKPINTEGVIVEPSKYVNWLMYLLGFIALILILYLLSPLLPYVVKFLVWLILLPYKFFVMLSNKIKESTKKRKGSKKK